MAAMTVPVHTPSPTPDRPLNAMDLADGAFAIVRGRPKVVATIVAAFLLPIQLLSTWLDRELYSAFSFSDFDTETGQFGDGELTGLAAFDGSLVSTVLRYAILPFIGVALTYLVLGWKEGIDRSAKDCLVFTLKKTHIIIVALVISKLLQGLSLLLTTPMTMLVAPVIAAEDVGPIRAVRRAFTLGKRRYGALFVLQLLVVLINVLLVYATLTIPIVAAGLLSDWGWVAYFALSSIGSAILTVFGIGAAVLAYVDVTNRTEGADLRRRMQNARASRV